MKTLLDRSCAGMVLEALSSVKDPRAGLTAGGMTEGLSFDMTIVPECPQADPTFYGGI